MGSESRSVMTSIKDASPEKSVTLQASTLVAVLGIGGGAWNYSQSLELKLEAQAERVIRMDAAVESLTAQVSAFQEQSRTTQQLRADFDRRLIRLEETCMRISETKQSRRK